VLNEYKLPCNSGRMGFPLPLSAYMQWKSQEGRKMSAEVLESHSAITRYYRIGKLLLEISLDFGLSSVLKYWENRARV